MIEAYDDHLSFISALRDVPGTHGIRDIYVATESITYRKQEPAFLNLVLIIDTEEGTGQEDARSWITSALDGYLGSGSRVTYDFTTFDKRPIGALSSVKSTIERKEREHTDDELLERLKTISS